MNPDNVYADFVFSRQWEGGVSKIREKSNLVAFLLDKYGIGSKITNDKYDFESGQLLEDVRHGILRDKVVEESVFEEEIEKVYELIVELAEAYASFAANYAV